MLSEHHFSVRGGTALFAVVLFSKCYTRDFFFSPAFSFKGMGLILHNGTWHTVTRSLVVNVSIFLGEILCLCRQESMLNTSRCSHYKVFLLLYHVCVM